MGNACVINVNISLNQLVSCCWRRTCSTRKSFRSLQKDWNRLRTAKNDVQTKIELEQREYKRRLESVGEWLEQVESIEIEFNKLKTNQPQQSDRKCFCGYCPRNLETSYLFGQKVAEVRGEMVSLLGRKPEEVTQNSLFAKPTKRPVGPIVGLQSMLDTVWKCFEDLQGGTIGLYGMGGVGKTTLLKEVNNKLCHSTQMPVDVVFWIVVSTNPNLTTIQNNIGEKLGFHSNDWKEKLQPEKAEDIYNVLTAKKYVLFLDDVWKRFDLLEMGVHIPNEANESKVVLTTRSYQVCCDMGVDIPVQVNCLGEEEAWNLFSKTVGENAINAHPEIQEIAKLVAKECDGLPLALIVIGRTMASRTIPRAWNHALNRLQKNTADFAGIGDDVLPLLKFSYDSLSNASMRSCFLYCSLYPEDYLIHKDDIIDKWVCENYLDRFDDLEKARNEGYDYIDTLVNVSLLEESSNGGIKMHDIIREMAIWIGCACGEIKNKFFVRAGVGLTETLNVAEFEGSERMSLMGNHISKLIGETNCPNLVTLFLGKAELSHIDNGFFESMTNLRVLDLSYNADLMEIQEEVCNLVNLQYLNLSNTKLSKLPINLCKLINLKWLGVSAIGGYIEFPEGMLSNLKKLRVLNLYNTEVDLPETFVEEMESLKQLNDLRIGISNDVHLFSFTSSHTLASFTTSLEVNRMTTTTNLDFLVSQKMVNLINLEIEECGELEYVTSREINGTTKVIKYSNSYFHSLKSLRIDWCPKLKDITVLTFAPNLETIYVKDCDEIEEMCGTWKWEQEHEGGSPTPFPKLKHLYLFDLPKLERIINPNTISLFPCLKDMEIYDCPMLKKLPFNSRSCDSGRGITTIEGEEEWWNGLEWEDDATRIAFLPSFKPENYSFSAYIKLLKGKGYSSAHLCSKP